MGKEPLFLLGKCYSDLGKRYVVDMATCTILFHVELQLLISLLMPIIQLPAILWNTFSRLRTFHLLRVHRSLQIMGGGVWCDQDK